VTSPGTVMGTAMYMSPEQAGGQTIDFRSDQFSLGSILYEMATGRRAFQRSTNVDTLSAIRHEEPVPMAVLAPNSPAPLRWIVDRCLAKDPRERYASTVDLARDLGSVRQHISELSGGEPTLRSAGRRRSPELMTWFAVAAALVLGAAAGFLFRGRGAAPSEARLPIRANLTFPSSAAPLPYADPAPFALSPDGRRLVYVGVAPQGRRLYMRSLDQFLPRPIPGSEGALEPFFSPDGQWVGFWAGGKLKKVSLAGGQPLTLCDAAVPRGASWGPDGTILFSWGASGLWRVSDKGGGARPLTTLDPAKGEGTHRWPEILPGGKAAIFTIHGLSGRYDNARIGVVLLETGQRRTVLDGATDARYLSTGHLVYLRGGSLFAVPFDLGRLAVTGPPAPVLDDVSYSGIIGLGNYSFSATGNLVYFVRDPKQGEAELVWIDRKGVTRPIAPFVSTDEDQNQLTSYAEIRLSPDGRRVAAVVGPEQPRIWIYDLVRNSWDRLMSESDNSNPVWTPDGQRLAFASNRSGSFNVFWMPIDRSQPAEQLTRGNEWVFPSSFSPDRRTLLVETNTPQTGLDISVVSLEGDRMPLSFLRTPAAEVNGKFSPDGRWVAYESDASGRPEIYVTGYPGPRGRWQISTDGGTNPVWSKEGRELFYRSSADTLMSVAVETKAQFSAGIPRPLFDLKDVVAYDASPDGQKFAAIRPVSRDTAPPSLAVVLNWFDDVKSRTAAAAKKGP